MSIYEGKLPKGWAIVIPGHNTSRRPLTGMERSPEYQSWYNMLARCYLPSYHAWNRYGGRGIGVHVRWIVGDGDKHGFLCYLEDMGCRPEGTTAGRYGDEGNYEPGNVIWQDTYDQGITRRRA